MTDRVVIVLPAAQWPGKLLNVNDTRGHTRYTGPRARPWRRLGWATARATHAAHLDGPVTVTASFRFPTNHVRDSANLYPTVKALLDGLVDADVLAGDDDRVIADTRIRREWPNGPARIILTIERGTPS